MSEETSPVNQNSLANGNRRVLNNIEVTEVMVQQGGSQAVHRRRRQISLEVQENSVSVQLNIRDNPSELNEVTSNENRELRASSVSQNPSAVLLMDMYIFTDSDVMSFYLDILLHYCHLVGMILLVQMKILWNMPIILIFGFTWYFDLIDLYRLFTKHLQLNHKKHRKRVFTLISEKLLIIAFKVMLFLFTQTEFFNSISTLFCLIPISLHFLLRFTMYFAFRRLGDCFTVVDFLNLGIRVFSITLAAFILLKYELIVEWEWEKVFWSYWIFFVVMVGVNIAQILLLITKYLQTLISGLPTGEIRGLVWAFMLSSTLNIQSCILVVGLIRYLERDDKNLVTSGFAVTLSTSILSLITCFIFKKDIITFIKILSSLEEGEGGHRADLRPDPNSRKHQAANNASEPIVIPKFLATDVVYPTSARTDPKKKKEPEEDQQLAKPEHRKSRSAAHSEIQNLIETLNSIPQKSRGSDSINPSSKRKSEQRADCRNYETVCSTTNENTTLNTLNTSARHLRMSTEKFETIDEREIQEEDLELGRSPSHLFSKRQNKDPQRRFKNEAAELGPEQIVKDDNIYIDSDGAAHQKKHTRFYSLDYRDKTDAVLKDNKPSMFKPVDTSQFYGNGNEKASDSGKDKSVLNCLVCFDKLPDAVFMDCGHGGICYECSLELWKSTGECYLCRKPIKQVLQIDMNGQKADCIKVISATHMIIDEKESDS